MIVFCCDPASFLASAALRVAIYSTSMSQFNLLSANALKKHEIQIKHTIPVP